LPAARSWQLIAADVGDLWPPRFASICLSFQRAFAAHDASARVAAFVGGYFTADLSYVLFTKRYRIAIG
jgi:hypothetical protein